jgi:hypothetical protein
MFPEEFGKINDFSYDTFYLLQAILMTDSCRRLADVIKNCRIVVKAWDGFKFKFHRHPLLMDQPYTCEARVLGRDLEKEVDGVRVFLKYRASFFQFEELESLQRNFAALIKLIDPNAPRL